MQTEYKGEVSEEKERKKYRDRSAQDENIFFLLQNCLHGITQRDNGLNRREDALLEVFQNLFGVERGLGRHAIQRY